MVNFIKQMNLFTQVNLKKEKPKGKAHTYLQMDHITTVIFITTKLKDKQESIDQNNFSTEEDSKIIPFKEKDNN